MLPETLDQIGKNEKKYSNFIWSNFSSLTSEYHHITPNHVMH